MKISKQTAQMLTNNYINFGNEAHFLYGSNRITGFIFTRQELFELLEDPNCHLFVMLGLSGDANSGHLNIVIGPVHDASSQINTNKLITSSLPPYTTSFNYSASLSIFGEKGDRVTRNVFDRLQQDYAQNSNNNHLTSTSGIKVKAYHLDHSDINHLTLNDQLNPDNLDDLFIFIPVIRDSFNSPYDRPYLSIAVAQYEGGEIGEVIIEYCLPCPTACPKNYPIQ